MKISKEAKQTLAPLVPDVHGHKMRDIGKEGQMRSRAAFLDVSEAASWIAAQLEREGVGVGDGLVLRILNRETAFLLLVGLARPSSEDPVQGRHIYREACWVLKPSAETAVDEEIEPEEKEEK